MNQFKKIIYWIFGVLDNSNYGISARKVVAFFLCFEVYKLDQHYVSIADAQFVISFQMVLLMHLVGIGFFLGLIVWDQLMQLKNGGKIPGGYPENKTENTEVK